MIHDDGAVRLVTGAQEGSPICRGTGLSLLRRLIIESSRDILIVEKLTKAEIRLAKINIELGPVFLKVRGLDRVTFFYHTFSTLSPPST